jgi:hypothetical protein
MGLREREDKLDQQVSTRCSQGGRIKVDSSRSLVMVEGHTRISDRTLAVEVVN